MKKTKIIKASFHGILLLLVRTDAFLILYTSSLLAPHPSFLLSSKQPLYSPYVRMLFFFFFLLDEFLWECYEVLLSIIMDFFSD